MISTTTAILRRQQIATQFTGGIAIAFLAIAAIFVAPTVLRADAPLPGAIFTTGFDGTNCSGVDLNIYASKSDVYINGGPSSPNAAGLADGYYCVQVTEPDGAVLGTSAPSAVHVTNGKFDSCYQLSSILFKASGGTQGYDTTTNSGGEYKVWVTNNSGTCDFTNSSTKTDNFKVREGETPVTGSLCVTKYYDANLDGVRDGSPLEPEIVGWQYTLSGDHNFGPTLKYTNSSNCLNLDPDTYYLLESDAPGWIHTTNISLTKDVTAGNTTTAEFGNVCVGTGGGLTLGFWSNKNGQKLESTTGFQNLTALCLVNANGAAVDFYGTAVKLAQDKTTLNGFLLNATATNMANMLSAQLATMYLNVAHGFVSGSALVYAPNLSACGSVTGLSSLGFISVNDLMTAANAALCADPKTLSGNPDRACQEALKTALDDANNNQNFLQNSLSNCLLQHPLPW